MPFSPSERKALLAVKGIGPMVVTRLEQLGFSTLKQLAAADATKVVQDAATLVGSTCWKNSPKACAAIQGAIAAAAAAGNSDPTPKTKSPRSSDATASTVAELRQLANLGPKSAEMLTSAGVLSFEHLRQLGSVAAFVMTKKSGARVSLNLLWALEAALSGQPWQTVAREHRTSLLLALEAHEVATSGKQARAFRTP